MSLSSEQLLSWAKSAPSEKSKQTVRIFKEMIEEVFGSIVDIYLQGSYANHTNIKTESDIDIVVCFKSLPNRLLSQQTTSNLALAQLPYQSLPLLRNVLFNQLQSIYNFSLKKALKQ